MDITERLTYRKIFLFWGPLALTWLMMAFEQPFLISFVSRLSDAKINLAAFGIAGSFAMIIEAPIIMLMSASTALVTGRHSYLKLKRFADLLNLTVTTAQLIMLIPPVFRFIVIEVMDVPEEVAALAHTALLIFLPWAASIGYRRFYQGILIRNHLTRRVTYGTMVRLTTIVVVGVLLYSTGIRGAYVGAAAMSVAVLLEAIATRWMALSTIRKLMETDDPGNSSLRLRTIAKFYYPLALTSLLSLGVHPFVTFFLGRSRMAVESLAVLPVVNSLVFIFRSLGLSFQEVTIALIGRERQNYAVLRNYATALGAVVTLLISLLAFTPLARLWFIDVSGLTEELAGLAYLPLKIMILLPAFTVLLNFQRALFVVNGTTGAISKATATELIGIIVLLFTGTVFLDLVGVVAAAVALAAGKGLSTLYLAPRQMKLLRQWKVQGGQEGSLRRFARERVMRERQAERLSDA